MSRCRLRLSRSLHGRCRVNRRAVTRSSAIRCSRACKCTTGSDKGPLRKSHQRRNKALSICAVADLAVIVESPTIHSPTLAYSASVSAIKGRARRDAGEGDAPDYRSWNQSVGSRSITQLAISIEAPTVSGAGGRHTARVTIVTCADRAEREPAGNWSKILPARGRAIAKLTDLIISPAVHGAVGGQPTCVSPTSAD